MFFWSWLAGMLVVGVLAATVSIVSRLRTRDSARTPPHAQVIVRESTSDSVRNIVIIVAVVIAGVLVLFVAGIAWLLHDMGHAWG